MSGTLPMKELQVVIDEVKARLSDRPKLAKLFENCYPNTLATTTKILEDGSTFVFTGDIPAMWLRDSSAQVRHYIGAAKRFPEVAELIPRFAADAEAYLAGAGIAPPEPEASSRPMYDQVVNYMVLDAWDHRDAWTPGSYTENPAFRRQLNQLKLTAPGGWF